MLYATIDEQGLVRGFYDDQVHAEIPAGAMPITEDLWRGWIADTAGQRWDGEGLVAYTPPAPPPVVPARVTRTQGLLALLGVGITEAMIRERIALIEDPVQREVMRLRFEGATWARDSEFITWGAEAFSLTAEQVAGLFIAAAAM